MEIDEADIRHRLGRIWEEYQAHIFSTDDMLDAMTDEVGLIIREYLKGNDNGRI